MSGALTPILWIFMPALIGFFTGIPYLYIVAKEAKPGVVFLMNLIVGVIYFIAGELSNLVIVTLMDPLTKMKYGLRNHILSPCFVPKHRRKDGLNHPF